MTIYDGGCFRCKKHEGKFMNSLPNGVGIHGLFAGKFFCDDCENKLLDCQETLEKEVDKYVKLRTERRVRAILKYG